MVFFDTPYGLGVADWDKQPLSAENLKLIVDQLPAINNSPCTTFILWAHWTMIASYVPVFKQSQFCNDIQAVMWYKENQNVEGPQEKFTHSWEMFIVARKKSSDAELNTCRMSRNPLERHNHLVGPTLSKYRVDVDGKKVNIHEKPTYLAKYL